MYLSYRMIWVTITAGLLLVGRFSFSYILFSKGNWLVQLFIHSIEPNRCFWNWIYNVRHHLTVVMGNKLYNKWPQNPYSNEYERCSAYNDSVLLKVMFTESVKHMQIIDPQNQPTNYYHSLDSVTHASSISIGALIAINKIECERRL